MVVTPSPKWEDCLSIKYHRDGTVVAHESAELDRIRSVIRSPSPPERCPSLCLVRARVDNLLSKQCDVLFQEFFFGFYHCLDKGGE